MLNVSISAYGFCRMHGEFGLTTVLHFVDVDMWLLLDAFDIKSLKQ